MQLKLSRIFQNIKIYIKNKREKGNNKVSPRRLSILKVLLKRINQYLDLIIEHVINCVNTCKIG